MSSPASSSTCRGSKPPSRRPKPFGVGLRLSAEAAADVARARCARRASARFLAAEDLFVFTINGFPYGAFHGQRVKETVYQPDWRDERRLTYTNHLADILAELLPASGSGSISTVPGTFKTLGTGAEALMADMMLRHAAHLIGLAASGTERPSRSPSSRNPAAFSKRSRRACGFLKTISFRRGAVTRIAELTGLGRRRGRNRAAAGISASATMSAMRRWSSRMRARASAPCGPHGIPIHKLQLSAALRLAPGPRQLEALQAFRRGSICIRW